MDAKQAQVIQDKLLASAPTLVNPSSVCHTRVRWRDRIRTFTWQWHVIVMGTGSCSNLFHNFPYYKGNDAFKIIALAFFLFGLVLFVVLCAWAIARCVMFPKERALMFRDPTTSVFIGFFTNGAASLINAGLSVNKDWNTGHNHLLYTLWGFWWLDSVLACLVAFGLIYATLGQASTGASLAQIRPQWMVPIITLITMSSSGGLFARALLPTAPTYAAATVGVSLTLLAIGLSFAMMLTTAFLLRLYLHGPLDATIVLTTFTTLTPLGQGGVSLLLNGTTAATYLAALPAGPNSVTGGCAALAGVALFGAYALWSTALAWIAVALFSLAHRAAGVRADLPRFRIGHWCVVVPNGVCANLSLQLALALDSGFFRAFGAAWACVSIAMWAVMAVRTVLAVADGSLFVPATPIAAPALPPPGTDVEKGKTGDVQEEKPESIGKLDEAQQDEVPGASLRAKSPDSESLAETLCHYEEDVTTISRRE